MREDRRHWFGRGATDWTFSLGGSTVSGSITTAPALATGPATLTMWSQETSGAQYTDLLDAGEAAITEVDSGNGVLLPVGTIPRFLGPPDITYMWADGGAGVRYLLVATDLGDAIADMLPLSGGNMSGELRLDDDSPAASQDYVDSAITAAGVAGAPLILPFSYDGIVSVRTGADRVYNDTGRALTIGTVRASAAVAPEGQALIVDVHKNGTTIYTTQASRPQIAAGQQTGTGGTPELATWAAGEYLTVDVDQVGTTTPGSGLTLTIVAA